MLQFITKPLFIYIFRCLIGFLIGYRLMLLLPQFELFWGLLSIILVISPEEKDSKKLSIDRVKSNFIGSVVGLFCVSIPVDQNVFLIMLGIIITSIICHLFNVMNMARVAIVALLFILLQKHISDGAITPVIRFLTVAVGCLIGLFITVTTSYLFEKIK